VAPLPTANYVSNASHMACHRYKDCEDRCSQAANLADDTRARLSDLIAAHAASVVGQVTTSCRLPQCFIVTVRAAERRRLQQQ
jgi:hypothetical protein